MQALRMKAARIAGQAELKDIRTAALHAEMDFPPAPGSTLGYELSADFEYALPTGPDELSVVVGRYTLPIWIEEDGERSQFAQLGYTLVALYDVPVPPEGEEFTEDEWDAFVKTTGQFALYPFARETAAMLTTRLGVPPLILGLLRLELDEDEVSDGQS